MSKRNRSDQSHAVLEEVSRRRKAQKIITILTSFIDLGQCDVLDIGTGAGVIASDISKHVKSMTSVDLFDERIETKGYRFIKVDSEKLPLKTNSFDIVISNHVIEHVPDQELHAREILRVLKPGGIAYLATPNRMWITDPHYKLPFINWMPRKLSSYYLNVVKKKTWDIFPVTHWRITKLVSDAKVIKAVPLIIKSSAESLDTYKGARKVLAILPEVTLKPIQYVGPTLVYVLKKTK